MLDAAGLRIGALHLPVFTLSLHPRLSLRRTSWECTHHGSASRPPLQDITLEELGALSDREAVPRPQLMKLMDIAQQVHATAQPPPAAGPAAVLLPSPAAGTENGSGTVLPPSGVISTLRSIKRDTSRKVRRVRGR